MEKIARERGRERGGGASDGVDATIAKHYLVTYSRWRPNDVRRRIFGANQNDFPELRVNLVRLNLRFLECKSISLSISFLFMTGRKLRAL